MASVDDEVVVEGEEDEEEDMGVDPIKRLVVATSGDTNIVEAAEVLDLRGRERWILEKKIGEGAFGEVYQGYDVITGVKVAVKLARLTGVPGNENSDDASIPKAVLRELWAQQRLVGVKNVTQYVAHFARGSSLAIVLGYCATDLRSLLEARKEGLEEAVVKSWTRMCLTGLAAIHSLGLMHRDLKPSNLLITASGDLQIGDFGQCRPVSRAGSFVVSTGGYSHQISTRAYRSPELLFGARNYGPSLDLWAVGCIVAEMIENSITFLANSDIEQLIVVFKVMGSPSPERWPSASLLPDFEKICFNDMSPKPMTDVAPHGSAELIQFLHRTLVLEPTRRATAQEASLDPFLLDERREDLAALVQATLDHQAAQPKKNDKPPDDDSW